VVTFVA
jgi:hypothetical protein